MFRKLPEPPISFFCASRYKGMDVLFEEEREMIQPAIPSRRSEFATGRWCAREAMKNLGLPMVPIMRGRGREPLWPAGVLGSITHTQGWVGAGVSREGKGLGLDMESLERDFPDSVSESICPKPELERAIVATGLESKPACVAIFSAKESFFKSIYPSLGASIPFGSVYVEFSPLADSYKTQVTFSPRPSITKRFQGEACITKTHILTWIHW